MKNTRLYLLVIAALVVGALLGSYSLAQSGGGRATGPSRVAVCDIVEVFNDYQRAKDLTAQLNQRREAIEQGAEQRGQNIEQKLQMLEALEEGSSQYEQLYQELQQLRFNREAWMKFQQDMATREHRKLTQEMYQEILDVIEQYAQENDVDAVLFRERRDVQANNTSELISKIAGRKVLYYDDDIDITQTILQQLNAAYRQRNGG